MRFKRVVVFVGLTVVMATAAQLRGAMIVDVGQVGSNVVAMGSGSIDLTDLSYDFSSGGGGAVNGNPVIVGLGVLAAVDNYTGVTGPLSIGTGGFTIADNATGNAFGVSAGSTSGPVAVSVPSGYTSGSSLSGTAEFTGQTIDGLGLTPGSYTWTWGSDAHADSFTVNIVVPEPATMGLFAVSGGLLALRRRR